MEANDLLASPLLSGAAQNHEGGMLSAPPGRALGNETESVREQSATMSAWQHVLRNDESATRVMCGSTSVGRLDHIALYE